MWLNRVTRDEIPGLGLGPDRGTQPGNHRSPDG